MLIFVICINVAITLLNLTLAQYIWRSRRSVRKITRILRRTEVDIQSTLENAPAVIAIAQVNVRQFRRSTQHWHNQWGTVQQIFSAVLWANQIYRRRQRSTPP